MNYIEWADEYYENALRVKAVIDKKKKRMKEEKLTADERKKLTDDIKAYRQIYRELTEIGDTLRDRQVRSA